MPKSKQKYLLPILALIVANVFFGINTILIKMGLESIPVPIFMAIRFLTASLILLPFAIYTWKPLKRKDLLLLVLCSVLYISLSALALNIGLTKTTSINAAAIWLLAPLVLFILSARFLKEGMNIKTFIGIMIALAGSVIIIGRPWEGGAGGLSGLTGNLLILISVLCSAISTIIFKPLMKKTSNYQATFMSIFPGVIPIALYALTQLSSWDIQATTDRSINGLIFSTIAVIIANCLFFYALHHKKAQNTGSYQYLDPLTTVLVAWFVLSERPTPAFVFGASIVLLGVYLSEDHRAKYALKNKIRRPR